MMKSSLWLHLLFALTCIACAGSGGTGFSGASGLQGLDGEPGFSNQANQTRDTSGSDQQNDGSDGSASNSSSGTGVNDSFSVRSGPGFAGSVDADLAPRGDLASAGNSSLVAPQPAPNPDVGDPELYGHYDFKYQYLLRGNSNSQFKDYIVGNHGGDGGDGDGGER
jgi:hypothetical protein